jgi:hypothetical protein
MKIKFDFATMSWQGLTVEQIQLWEHLYPDIDVIHVLKYDMPQWLDKKNGTKKVQKKNYKAFICNWLRRAQEAAL